MSSRKALGGRDWGLVTAALPAQWHLKNFPNSGCGFLHHRQVREFLGYTSSSQIHARVPGQELVGVGIGL